MSREILFKAKRLDTGKWVEGYYVCSFQKHYIFQYNECGFISHIVDQPTLCQYTGLTDKSDRKIWENDILCGYLDDEYPENRTLKKVIWNTGGFYTKEECSTDLEPLDEFDAEHFETCGNIFDNPELFEV